jgi:hypothetical protein
VPRPLRAMLAEQLTGARIEQPDLLAVPLDRDRAADPARRGCQRSPYSEPPGSITFLSEEGAWRDGEVR